MKKEENKIDPKVKDILILLGAGAFISASIIFPGLPLLAKEIIKIAGDSEKKRTKQDWEKYNLWRLRQVIKRMQQTKYVEINEENGATCIKITQKGKLKLLRYEIDKMKLDQSKLDGYWRVIIYDVKAKKKQSSEMFRRAIAKLNLLKLQKSVYLTPYKCEDEIEYLRQIFEIGSEVLILKVKNLENEAAYKRYFSI